MMILRCVWCAQCCHIGRILNIHQNDTQRASERTISMVENSNRTEIPLCMITSELRINRHLCVTRTHSHRQWRILGARRCIYEYTNIEIGGYSQKRSLSGVTLIAAYTIELYWKIQRKSARYSDNFCLACSFDDGKGHNFENKCSSSPICMWVHYTLRQM